MSSIKTEKKSQLNNYVVTFENNEEILYSCSVLATSKVLAVKAARRDAGDKKLDGFECIDIKMVGV